LKDLRNYLEYSYRVYRSFTIPYNGNKVYELSAKREGEEWIKLLEVLQEFLRESDETNALNYVKYEEKLDAIGDLIALFFKAPLLADPLQGLIPSPMKLYFPTRFPIEVNGKSIVKIPEEDPFDIDVLSNVIDFIEKLESFENIKYWRPVRRLYDYDVSEMIARAWLIYPADTRPGFNASSLVSHLLTTSSLTWIWAQTNKLNRVESAKLRLAAMIHDMAKPINPKKHAQVVGPLAKELFSGILSDETVASIAYLAKRHHEIEALTEADRYSASIDRIKELANRILAKYFERREIIEIAERIVGHSTQSVFDLAYGTGEDAWRFWETLDSEYPNLIKEMSQDFVETIIKSPDGIIWEEGIGDHHSYPDALYLLVDVGGIQSFIRSFNKLRLVAAASQIIDLLVYFIIPHYIQRRLEKMAGVSLPIENFYVMGGGNVAAVVPKYLKDIIVDALKSLNIALARKDWGISIRHAFYELTGFMPSLLDGVAKEIAISKMTEEVPVIERTLPDNLGRLCKSCYSREIYDQNEEMCKECVEIDQLGKEISVRKKRDKGFILNKTEVKPKHFWKDEELFLENVMEIISGLDENEIIARPARIPNVACIKGDGNNMGKFIQSSFSLSDFIEKSFRIDMAMKKAYLSALNKLIKASNNDELGLKDACSIWIGTIYVGGDDFLIFTPSWAAIPFVYELAYVFRREMGDRCSLSFGLVAIPPKHSVWHAIEVADSLLTQAKKLSRKRNEEAICFDAIEQGVLTSGTAMARLHIHTVLGIGMRKLKLYGMGDGEITLQSLLSKLLNNEVVSDTERMFKMTSDGFYSAKLEDKLEVSDVVDKLKKYRRIIKETLTACKIMLGNISSENKEYFLGLAVLYSKRQATRYSAGDGNVAAAREAYEAISEVILTQLTKEKIQNEDNLSSPLIDMDTIAKILGGGLL